MRRGMLIGLVLAIPLVGGAALAGVTAGSTAAVSGTYNLKPKFLDSEVCAGADGNYVKTTSLLSGPFKSADPRLTGPSKGAVLTAVREGTEIGTALAFVDISDPGTLVSKAFVLFVGTIDHGAIKGVLIGDLADGSLLVANTSAVFSSGRFRGSFGDDPRVPAEHALTQDGDCGPPIAPGLSPARALLARLSR